METVSVIEQAMELVKSNIYSILGVAVPILIAVIGVQVGIKFGMKKMLKMMHDDSY